MKRLVHSKIYTISLYFPKLFHTSNKMEAVLSEGSAFEEYSWSVLDTTELLVGMELDLGIH